MKNNITINIIKSLTSSEIRGFRKAAQSPYFTHRTDFYSLFYYLEKFKDKPSSIDKRKLYEYCWPQEPYKDVKLRAALSDLKELIEKFLVTNEILKNSEKLNQALLRIYSHKQLPDAFSKKLKQAEKLIAKKQTIGFHKMKMELNIQEEELKFLTRQQRTAELPLQAISQKMNRLFILEKLKHACLQLSHQLVYKTEYQFDFLQVLIPIIEKGNYLEDPSIALRYYCFQFLKNPDAQKEFKLFSTLLNKDIQFETEELKDLFLLGINYCIRQLNQGSLFYLEEAWILYQAGLEKKVLLEEQQLSRFTFNNIIAIGIKLKKNEALETFIKTYQDFLPLQDKDSLVFFNKARMAYAQKDYDEVISSLQKVSFRDVVDNLIAKSLLSKVYFEIEEQDLLEAHLNSFAQYLRRGKIGKYHNQNYKNFIVFLRKLITIPPFEKEKREQLKQQIEDCEILTERQWLLNRF